MFKPRRKQELTFTGNFWVTDTTFAIKKMELRIAKDANINFVNDLLVNHEYSLVNDTTWFLTKDQMFVDFNLQDSTTGFFATKTTSYKDVHMNKKYEENIIPSKVKIGIILLFIITTVFSIFYYLIFPFLQKVFLPNEYYAGSAIFIWFIMAGSFQVFYWILNFY